MKIRLHGGPTLTDATMAMIKALDNSVFSVMHTIIVPDRFSLQCEKLILQMLDRKALFNVRVVNLTKFSTELLLALGESKVKNEVLSSGEVLLLTAKAIENVANDFKTFKRGGIDFCHEVSKLISQFKSSGIMPEDLMQGEGYMATNKYHDLALIYNEYEKLLGDKLDANARLAMLSEKLKDSGLLEGTKIYFAQFDAFTKAGYDLIKTFAQNADEVNISFTQPQSIGNEYIYETDILSKIKKLSNESGGLVEILCPNQPQTLQKKAMIEGLFSYQKSHCDNDGFFNLISCVSSAEEIESVAKLIRYKVFNGSKYRDFQIAVGGLSKMQSQIENIFLQYDIPFYTDTSVTADKTILGILIKSYFDVATMGFGHDKLVDLLASALANEKTEIVEICQRYAVEGKYGFKKYIEKNFVNADILALIEEGRNADDFGKVVCEILNRAEEKHNQILQRLEEEGELKTKNINSQIPQIIKDAVALISKEYQGEITASQYFKLLNLLLSFKQVSSVPTFVDGVFVGDATESFFGESDFLLVLNGESLPVVSNDNGLLTDEELNIDMSNPIEPTIKMINRRNRFKFFSLLPLAKKQLIVFARRIDDEGKKQENPTYIKNLCDIFGQREINAGRVFFSNKIKDNEQLLLSAPYKKRQVYDNKEECEIKNLSNLVFKNGKARVTQIEQYFSCPFKHFATYGLKLKEFEIEKFEPKDIGNLCHRGAELLLQNFSHNEEIMSWGKEELSGFIEKNFAKIVSDEKLTEKINDLVEKETLVRFIKNQMLCLFEKIVFELSASKFKPALLEYKFDDCEVGAGNISVVGKADRIDVCGDYFRIIDYKTGTTGNVLKELKYGQKLQLFLYQKFAGEKLGKKSGGVFYFDARFDYSNGEDEGFILKGLAPNDQTLVSILDKNIEENEKSEILSIYKSKRDGQYKGSALSKEDMQILSQYAQEITAKAIGEIEEGFVQAKPYSESCLRCKYFSVCRHEKSKGERKLLKI